VLPHRASASIVTSTMLIPTGAAASLDARDVRVVLGGVVAVDDASLHVASGRCVALVGESGAGKTTLLRCFNRMVTPSASTVMVGGIDVMREPPAELRRRSFASTEPVAARRGTWS
jgi:ABC-type multidrug transport system ATPase subunit